MDMKSEFSKEPMEMASKYGKKCFMYLALRGMHIKTSVRFHTTFVKMTTIQNKTAR